MQAIEYAGALVEAVAGDRDVTLGAIEELGDDDLRVAREARAGVGAGPDEIEAGAARALTLGGDGVEQQAEGADSAGEGQEGSEWPNPRCVSPDPAQGGAENTVAEVVSNRRRSSVEISVRSTPPLRPRFAHGQTPKKASSFGWRRAGTTSARSR